MNKNNKINNKTLFNRLIYRSYKQLNNFGISNGICDV